MTTEVELSNEKKPVIMDISAYSNLSHKLNFMAQGLRDLKDAETQLVYIECYTKTEKKDDEEKNINIIRFSTDVSIWTEISPLNKYTTPILEKPIAVNLFDLFNVVQNCMSDDTEFISFRIDETDSANPNLVVSGFYNELREYNEMETSLKIHKIGFPRREFKSPKDDGVVTTLELDHLALYNILRMNTENKTEGVNFVIKDKKISFQTIYNGLKTSLIIKAYKDQLFFKDITVFMPFYFLNLMVGTGDIENVKFHIFSDSVVVEAGGYNFVYNIEKEVEIFDISDDGLEDFCVVDPKNAEAVITLLNKINKPSPISIATITKLEDKIAEIQTGIDGRYKISVLMECIMQTETPITVDADILQWMVTNTQVDGIKIQRYANTNDMYISYENELFIKKIQYLHDVFVDYRSVDANKKVGV